MSGRGYVAGSGVGKAEEGVRQGLMVGTRGKG